MLLSLLTFLFSLLSFPPFSSQWSLKKSMERVRILPPVDECVGELERQRLQGLTGDADPYIWGCREVWIMTMHTRNFIALTFVHHVLVLHVHTQSPGQPTREVGFNSQVRKPRLERSADSLKVTQLLYGEASVCIQPAWLHPSHHGRITHGSF